VFTRGGSRIDRRASREALDQRVDQLLLQPVCRCGINHRSRSPLDQADSGRMEVPQRPDHHRPRVPPTRGGRDRKRRSGQRTAVLSQVRGRQPDRPPAARPIGSHVQAAARPERHDLARRQPNPPQIGAGPLPLGSETRIVSAGEATKAIRGRCSSVADSLRLCRATWVSRARNRPAPVTSRAGQPSSRMAAAKSSASLNTDVTLIGIVTRPFCCRTKGAGCAPRLAIQFWQKRTGPSPKCSTSSPSRP
jgi:hypothetical protein